MLRSLRMVSHSLSRRDKALPRQNRLLGTSTTSILREQPVPHLPLNHNPCSSNSSPRKCSSLLVPGTIAVVAVVWLFLSQVFALKQVMGLNLRRTALTVAVGLLILAFIGLQFGTS